MERCTTLLELEGWRDGGFGDCYLSYIFLVSFSRGL